MKARVQTYGYELKRQWKKYHVKEKYFNPFFTGFYGFLSVLFVITFARLLSSFGGKMEMIDSFDLLLAGLGFALMFLESILKKYL